MGFEEGGVQATGDVAAQVGNDRPERLPSLGFNRSPRSSTFCPKLWIQDLGGDRLSEQGFVGVFELDDWVFYHQGQGVELPGDFVVAAAGKLEVGMGKPGIGQHLDDQILEGDGGGDLELVAADIQEGEEEEVFVGVGGVVE